MKTLFYLCNAMMIVLALVACGGDEPAPVGPNEPTEDTTVVDTVPTDTMVEDTTERDSSISYYIQAEERILQDFQCNLEEYEYSLNSVQGGFPDFHENFSSSRNKAPRFEVPLDEDFILSLRKQGYVKQTVWSRVMWPRMIRFDMQPCSTSGMSVNEVNAATGRVSVLNDTDNQQTTGLKATVSIMGGSIGQTGDDSLFSAVTFLPAASPADQLVVEGQTLKGAVAGVAVTPFKTTFGEKAHVCVSLPQNVEGHRLSVMSFERDRAAAVVKGQDVEFDVPSGQEWAVLMEAKVVGIETDTVYMEYQEYGRGTGVGIYEATREFYYMDILRHYAQTGYEAESELDFMEERFLKSLFGVRSDILTEIMICADHRFNMVYNLGQEVHHITFEAAGRRFRARVYGNTFAEVVSLKREYWNNQ